MCNTIRRSGLNSTFLLIEDARSGGIGHKFTRVVLSFTQALLTHRRYKSTFTPTKPKLLVMMHSIYSTVMTNCFMQDVISPDDFPILNYTSVIDVHVEARRYMICSVYLVIRQSSASSVI